ncbi:MAG: hexosaminidase, partial [Zhongshania aliphaticivorans]
GPKDEEPLAIGEMLTLKQVYSFDPVIPELQDNSEQILGAQGQLWREYLPTTESVEYMAHPRSCALAEILWLPNEKKNFEDFLERMKNQEARFDAAGVNYRKIDR